jgi:hypothetical protein
MEPEKQPLLSNTRKQKYNNGVMKPVSKQWFGKRVSAVNTSQQQRETLFYVVRAATVVNHWCGKHASIIERLCFLRGPCRGVILKTIAAKLDKEKPGIGNIKGLNLAAVKSTTGQVSDCGF